MMDQPPAKRATLRLGARELRRMQTGVVCLIIVLLGLALRPWFLNTIQVRDFQVCQSHLRSISQSLQNYSNDWDGAYPPGEHWMDHSMAYLHVTSADPKAIEGAYRCPRDRTGEGYSYVYNSLFSGMNPTVRSEEPKLVAQGKRLGRVDRAVLIMEKHGGQRNAHMEIDDWNVVRHEMTRPHELKSATGSYIRGNGKVGSKNSDDLQEVTDKRF